MRLDLYDNADTETILAAIGIKEDGIPRLRGVGIDSGKVLIHTRTGGGNRNQYDSVDSYIHGEYGIDYSIEEAKTPGSWSHKYHTEKGDLAEHIAELEALRQRVIETKEGTNDYLRSSPYFLYDEDEEFDSTYANFWYRIPEQEQQLTALEDVESKAVLGDAQVAIGLQFGDKEAIEKAQSRLAAVRKNKATA